MPPIYAIISFLSYRFFRSYTYYDLVETGAHLGSVLLAHKLTPPTFSLRIHNDQCIHVSTPVDLLYLLRRCIERDSARLLLIQYVAATAAGNDVNNAIARKDKSKLPMPVRLPLILQ